MRMYHSLMWRLKYLHIQFMYPSCYANSAMRSTKWLREYALFVVYVVEILVLRDYLHEKNVRKNVSNVCTNICCRRYHVTTVIWCTRRINLEMMYPVLRCLLTSQSKWCVCPPWNLAVANSIDNDKIRELHNVKKTPSEDNMQFSTLLHSSHM